VRLIPAALLTSLLAACGGNPGGGSPDPDAPDARPAAPDGGGAPRFQRCVGADFTPEPATGTWRTTRSSVITTGSPNHSSQDLLVNPGAPALLRGKFTYGPLGLDLQDEIIRVSVYDCSSWVRVEDAITDSDGRIEVEAPSLPVGVYDVRLQVAGDATVTASTLWVLPSGTHLIVSDIDGTLTTSDSELFREILDGSHVPEAYPGGPELLGAHERLGHVVVYLTGRPYPLTGVTRDWLAELRFPVGPLHVVDDVIDAIPSDAEVGAFKRDFLMSLEDKGFVLDLAYGNATTDIFAYLEVGIPADDVWIIGPNAGQQATNPVTDSWAPRAAEVEALAPIAQPFTR
jgi:phosphatidate phosphatase PAH1